MRRDSTPDLAAFGEGKTYRSAVIFVLLGSRFFIPPSVIAA